MTHDSLQKHIYELERCLLQSEVRQSAEKVAELLSDDFFEFCSSGMIYKYKKGDVIDSEKNFAVKEWEIKDFSIKNLSEDIILANYKLIKNNKKESEKKYSLRSSIWKNVNGQWKMVFHQGTITNGF